jgi:hypothetical protein
MTVRRQLYLEDTSLGHYKFYLIMLEELSPGNYETWARFGRIGTEGQRTSKYRGTSLRTAESAYAAAEADRYRPGKEYRIAPVPNRWQAQAMTTPTNLPHLTVDPARYAAAVGDPIFAVQQGHATARAVVTERYPDKSVRAILLLEAPDAIHRTLLDIIQYKQGDVRGWPLYERMSVLDQAIAEALADGASPNQWQLSPLRSGPDKQTMLRGQRSNLFLRRLSSAYDDPEGWLLERT